MLRTPLLVGTLAACVGVPYLMTEGKLPQSFDQLVNSAKPAPGTAERLIADVKSTASSLAQAADQTAQESAQVLARAATAPVEAATTPPIRLEEAFRFELTKAWVLGHWPRVSTRLANLDLEGYRVPLVAGQGEASLAGSVTYYFNQQQELQRIVFLGSTGDARPLVAHLESRLGFTRKLTDDPGLYLYQVKHRRDKAESELRMRAANVVDATRPLQRFEVALWIERPEEK